MTEFWQSRDNIIYLAGAEHSAHKGRHAPADNQIDPDLPQGNPKRWTARRKAAVILAIHKKIISVWDACEHYDLSAAELAEWERDLNRFGVPGLRATKILYRKTSISK